LPLTVAASGRSHGAVRSTEPRTFSCGKSAPELPHSNRDHAPAAMTTASAATRPRSVTTPSTRPAAVSRPRTAHCSNRAAPCRRASVAMPWVASSGSATPSEALYMAPLQGRHEAGRQRSAAARPSRAASTP